uniref:Ephrin_rec_like domain-containing protein n=1 Tax=Angiostrongylus cantonensis TaxID=6313 RepID=A0A0K0DPX0_ANGCA
LSVVQNSDRMEIMVGLPQPARTGYQSGLLTQQTPLIAACHRCPVETIPNYGYQFVQWNTLPPNMVTRCEYISEEISTACNIGEAWLASGTALVSAQSLQRGIAMELELIINEGFSNPLAPRDFTASQHSPVAQFSVVFETSCADSSCVLYMIESPVEQSKTQPYRFLAAFNGSQPRRVWSHSILEPRSARFMVAFLRSGSTSGDDAILDQARILSINVTNTGVYRGVQGGGASRCLPCPKGSFGKCVPCPPGHYMSLGTHECIPCPPNTVVNTTSERIGVESCIKCGQNLHSSDGVACTSDGILTVIRNNRTLNYDLSAWLRKTWTATGVKVFAREGASYYHSFNFSLFSEKVQCKEAYDSNDAFPMNDQSREVVTGAACRLTVLPDIGRNRTKLGFVSPLLILKTFCVFFTMNSFIYTSYTPLVKCSSITEGVEEASRPIDVHFWFDALGATSEACPRGNAYVATARCAPGKKEAEFRLPRTCPDGTCDGCLFHAIVESVQACPVCRAGDYEMIRGECVNGQQTIHYIPDKHCVLTGKEAQSRNDSCSVLSEKEKLMLSTGILAFIILCVAFVVICQRNRRLEYKYTRLVESRSDELPTAETCGLVDDEDDEAADRVIFAKGRRKIFSGRDTDAFFLFPSCSVN